MWRSPLFPVDSLYITTSTTTITITTITAFGARGSVGSRREMGGNTTDYCQIPTLKHRDQHLCGYVRFDPQLSDFRWPWCWFGCVDGWT